MIRKDKEFVQAREHMIKSQIHPLGVTSPALLEAFFDVPRELFVPEEQRRICYCDEDIEIENGRYLMEASVWGRMVQAVIPKKDDVALVIASGAGYNAAILSFLVSTVIALEEHQEFIDRAQTNWDALACCNIATIKGELCHGAPKHAPYDLIFINGAVSNIPNDIKEQLAPEGRLIALVKKSNQSMAQATLLIRNFDKEASFSERILFDSGTPYLVGCEPTKEFVF